MNETVKTGVGDPTAPIVVNAGKETETRFEHACTKNLVSAPPTPVRVRLAKLSVETPRLYMLKSAPTDSSSGTLKVTKRGQLFMSTKLGTVFKSGMEIYVTFGLSAIFK